MAPKQERGLRVLLTALAATADRGLGGRRLLQTLPPRPCCRPAPALAGRRPLATLGCGTPNWEGIREQLRRIRQSACVEVTPTTSSGAIDKHLPVSSTGVVYVNWVEESLEHGRAVASMAGLLHSRGIAAIPHLPICRFGSEQELFDCMQDLRGAGVDTVLLVGGNDQKERVESGAVPEHFRSVVKFLESPLLAEMKSCGIRAVAIGGYPEGHPAVHGDLEASEEHLKRKATAVLAQGIDLIITTQFSFDPRTVVAWATRTKTVLDTLCADLGLEPRFEGEPARIRFHIGAAGPTPSAQMKRISSWCQVPDQFMGSLFRAVDQDGDGRVSLLELETARDWLGVPSSFKVEQLLQTYQYADADHASLSPLEFASMIVDFCSASRGPSSAGASPWSGILGKGPSTSITPLEHIDASTPQHTVDDLVAPSELVLCLACLRERWRQEGRTHPVSDLVLHIFPFGGVRRARSFLQNVESESLGLKV